jgi:trigger factor
MKVQVEEISPTRRKIAVEVPVERVADEFDRAFRAVSRGAKIKGFRPGRVPRTVLQRYFGEDVRNQVATSLVRESLSEAMQDSKLDVVSPPELEIEPLDERAPLRFSALVDVRPGIGPIETTGFRAERPSDVVPEAEVDRVLEQIRLRYAELVPIEGRTDLARGDFATVNITVDSNGEPIPSLGVDSATVEVAAGRLPGPVDERLALARVGETFSVEGPAPDGAGPELAGKPLRYSVTVSKIAERRLPDLDDEFAKDHGDCETLAELRAKIREQLERDARRRADGALRDALIDQLIERNAFEAPLSMVNQRVEQLLENFKLELRGQGLQLTSHEHEDEVREKIRSRAEREVRAQLILDALAGQLDVTIGDDELAERIGQIAAAAGDHREQVREHYAHEHARDAVRSEMRRSRTLERLVSLADVSEGKRPEP